MTQVKKFVSNDEFTYTLERNLTAGTQKWSKAPEYNNDIRNDRLSDAFSEFELFFAQIPSAGSSVSRLNSAYSKVADITEDAIEQKYLNQGKTMTADYSVNISVSKNGGSNVLTTTYKYIEDFDQTKTEYTMVSTVVETSGYLSRSALLCNIVDLNKQTNEQTQRNLGFNIDITYSFDEIAYDLLPSTPDGNVSQSVFDEYKMKKNIVVNGKDFGMFEASGYSHLNAMQNLIKEFKKKMNSESEGELNMAIYFDSACTNQVDLTTITKDEFLSTETFYITLSLNDAFAQTHNRALINKIEQNVWDSSVCEEYKLVFSGFLNTNEVYSMKLIGNTAQKQTVSQSASKKHYLDGVLFTENYYYLTNGQVCTHKTETIYTQDSYNLRMLFIQF